MNLFPNSIRNAVQSEVQMRFPMLSQTRFAPYTPYRAPAGGTRCIPRRRTAVAAVAKTFTKDVVLLTKDDGECIPRGSRRSVLYDGGQIANMVDFQSSWSEEQVRGRIEHCFKGLINLEKPYPRYVLKLVGATTEADPGGVRWVRTNPPFCPGFY